MMPRIGAGIVLTALAVGVLAQERLTSPDLVVLCSNNVESCVAVVAEYEEMTGADVTVVRMPTTEALARIRVPKDVGEFDVWMGGPADAYTLAANEGLLAVPDIADSSNIPADLKDPDGRWYGIYGGILAFCVAADAQAPRTWEDLPEHDGVVIPNPLTSGTALTMLSVHYERLGSVDAAMAYMARLDDTVLTYTDSGTVPAHVVGSGRADVGVTFGPYCEREQLLGYDVTTVYPLDGTGFEVGAIAVLDESSARVEATRFVTFTISDTGQQIGAAAASQLPVSDRLDIHLTQELEDLDVPIFGRDMVAAGERRTDLITAWVRQVRHGAY